MLDPEEVLAAQLASQEVDTFAAYRRNLQRYSEKYELPKQEARTSGNFKYTHAEFRKLQQVQNKTPSQWQRFERVMGDLGLTDAEKYQERGSP